MEEQREAHICRFLFEIDRTQDLEHNKEAVLVYMDECKVTSLNVMK